MSRVTSFFNRLLALVLLLSSGARMAVARILPSSQPTQPPASEKVFALSETEWLEMRGGMPDSAQKKGDSKPAEDQPSKKADEPAAPAKDSGKPESPKSADCKGTAPKPGDEGRSSSPDKKKEDGGKPACEAGPGGGDGDMGGTGG